MASRHTLVRDARLTCEYYPEELQPVEIQGRITRTWGRSNRTRFLELQDISDSIQIVVEKEKLSAEVSHAFANVRPGVGVAIRGTIGRSNNGTVSLFPTEPPTPLRAIGEVDLIAEDLSGVATQVLLSRLESFVRSELIKSNFIELTPRFLSSSWPKGGLEPLRVQFAGQSVVPLYLAVSPIPQLVRAILAVGDSDFFSISRTFATNFVATQNGAESVVAATIQMGQSISAVAADSVGLAQRLLVRPETGTDAEIRRHWAATPTTSSSGSLGMPSPSPEGLHLHNCTEDRPELGPGGFHVGNSFQVHWRSQLVLVDGYELLLSDQIRAIVRVFYVERCLHLLRAQDNFRIRDIVHPHTPNEGLSDADPAGSEN